MKALLISTICALVLSGCATTPTPIAEAQATPQSRIFMHPVATDKAATAIFVRDRGLVGSGISIHLSINEEKAASIDTGEKVTFRLSAGEYLFSVIPTDPFGTHAVFSIDQRLDDGKVYTYRILTDGDDMKTRIQRAINAK